MNQISPTPEEIESSSDQLFLQLAERQRLERECLCVLDLRDISSDFCRCFTYRGRTMWLDPASVERLQDGLIKNSGVFTIETYEEILSNVKRKESVLVPDEPDPDIPKQMERILEEVDIFIAHSAERRSYKVKSVSSSTFDLGYFKKRVEDRIKQRIPALLIFNRKVVPVETLNISFGGLRIRSKIPIALDRGDRVQIKVSPGAGTTGGKLPEAAYKVIRVTPALSDTFIALACEEDESNGTVVFFREIVASQLGNEEDLSNLDSEDALLTSYSLLAERFYMRSSSIIPFFLFQVEAKEAQLRLAFSNANNERALKAFEDASGNFDLGVLAHREFVKLLAKLAQCESQSDALLAVLRRESTDSPLVLMNTACKRSRDWYQFISDHFDQPGFFVFKVISCRVHRHISPKIRNDLDALSSQSTDLAHGLLKDAEKLFIAGALIDVTPQIRTWDLRALSTGFRVKAEGCLSAAKDDVQIPAPEVWPISFIEEKRSEPRYLSQLAIEFKVPSSNYRGTGRARDISTYGLSIVADDAEIAAKKGEHILISFPNIKGGSSSWEHFRATYRDVPYELIDAESGSATVLRLRQIPGRHSNRFANAFSKYIEQRKTKLPFELSHMVRSAASRLYSSVFIESSATIPVFIFQRQHKNQQCTLKIKIGIVKSSSYLAKFFEVVEGEFDFNIFGEADRLERLLQAVEQQGTAELPLFLYKEKIPGLPRFRIRTVPRSDLGDNRQRNNFINSSFEHDFRYVKLVVSRPQTPPPLEIEQAIDRLRNYSKPKIDHFKSDFSDLVAIGDIVDVTGQFADLQPVALFQGNYSPVSA